MIPVDLDELRRRGRDQLERERERERRRWSRARHPSNIHRDALGDGIDWEGSDT